MQGGIGSQGGRGKQGGSGGGGHGMQGGAAVEQGEVVRRRDLHEQHVHRSQLRRLRQRLSRSSSDGGQGRHGGSGTEHGDRLRRRDLNAQHVARSQLRRRGLHSRSSSDFSDRWQRRQHDFRRGSSRPQHAQYPHGGVGFVSFTTLGAAQIFSSEPHGTHSKDSRPGQLSSQEDVLVRGQRCEPPSHTNHGSFAAHRGQPLQGCMLWPREYQVVTATGLGLARAGMREGVGQRRQQPPRRPPHRRSSSSSSSQHRPQRAL